MGAPSPAITAAAKSSTSPRFALGLRFEHLDRIARHDPRLRRDRLREAGHGLLGGELTGTPVLLLALHRRQR
jgi:hypothetical protein